MSCEILQLLMLQAFLECNNQIEQKSLQRIRPAAPIGWMIISVKEMSNMRSVKPIFPAKLKLTILYVILFYSRHIEMMMYKS